MIMNEKQYFFTDTLKIPLIVGITGHIDILTPESEIKTQLNIFWEKLQSLTGPDTPIILLTSIAAGADHLTVKYLPQNVKYCVVLPFDEAEYRKDFSGQDLASFEDDLKGAFKVISCQAEAGNYAPAADYIRRYADVLLSMWDGYANLNTQTGKAESGGTYYQIRAAFGMDDLLLSHQEKKHLIVNLPVVRSRKGPEYHLQHGEKLIPGYPENNLLSAITRKEETEELIFTPFADYSITSAGDSPDSEENIEFPQILEFLKKHNANLPATPYHDPYLRPEMEKFPEAMNIVQDDFSRYEYFDAKSQKHQIPHKKQFFLIALFSIFIGILGQAWGDLDFSEEVIHCIIFLYLLGCAAIFLYGRKIARENHYLHYLNPRIIAEFLRLKIFWKLSGIRESFTDYLLEESASYLFALPFSNWMIAERPLPEETSKWLDDGKGLPAVSNCWLKDQKNYYNSYLLPDSNHFLLSQPGEKCKNLPFLSPQWLKQYFKKYERLEGYSKLGKNFFTWSAFILSGVLIFIFIAAKIFKFDHTEVLWLSFYREFLVGICPFSVATLGWLLEKKNWDSLGYQYRNTVKLFDKTIKFVESNNHTVEEKKQIIKELMLYAHQENTEWNNIKKNAEPEPMM